ncbi:MAG TPA: cell wall-binding repeat-containing protein, partial [Egibacteraceae bacterium]|nr:cell wall-binding repeat-containing protein [Egibacteraceae bacterium]
MSAPAPAEPARSCELVGPEPGIVDDFGFWNPSWSPDGSALVYELNAAFADSPQPAGAGIYLASGFDADCAQAFAGTQLVVPGGSQPDWSAAPLGATPPGPEPTPTEPPPTDEPTEPPVTAGGGFDGDPASTERIDHADPTAAAVAISRARFADGQADHVVLSRDDTFPDSLAGAPLTAGGPLLLTATATLSDATAAELDRVLPDGGVVYLLGGVAAIGQGVQDTLAARGYDVRRLAGPSRVETAVAVADQVRALNPGVGEAGLA